MYRRLTCPLSREALVTIVERRVGSSGMLAPVVRVRDRPPQVATGTTGHRPPLDPPTDQPRRGVSSALITRLMRAARAARRVPLAATPIPPKSTPPRTTTGRSRAHKRVERPVPVAIRVFAFVVFSQRAE